MADNRGFWGWASDHPYLTFFGTLLGISGIAAVARAVHGSSSSGTSRDALGPAGAFERAAYQPSSNDESLLKLIKEWCDALPSGLLTFKTSKAAQAIAMLAPLKGWDGQWRPSEGDPDPSALYAVVKDDGDGPPFADVVQSAMGPTRMIGIGVNNFRHIADGSGYFANLVSFDASKQAMYRWPDGGMPPVFGGPPILIAAPTS